MATLPQNASVQALPTGPAAAPTVPAPVQAPVRTLNTMVLRNLNSKLMSLFQRYASDRLPAEQRWVRNLRQYLGIYDPEIERSLAQNRSRAYPRLTRMKCISLLSRVMNLMFPGNEDNWELSASPSPEMDPNDVAQAVAELIDMRKNAGLQAPLTQDLVDEAVKTLADKQAAKLSLLIKDQLLELGGDQSLDWILLNRKVLDSGIKMGIGVLEGPYIRKIETSGWEILAPAGPGKPGGFQPVKKTVYKPQYEHLPVWDFYPDMTARTLPGEGYFVRKILGRSALRKLADRKDFFGPQIKEVLTNLPGGNYKPKTWENDLKTMGVAINAQQQSAQASMREKYEVIVWKGPVSAATLREAGADVPESFIADDVEADIWMIDTYVIKAEINQWRKLGVDMRCVHIFNFDEDDTSPIGQGLPNIVRDSALSIAAATRMTLDNASVVCGPQFEINTRLMRADQDLIGVAAYKNWYRDDDGLTAQFPAIRRIEVDGHLTELQSLVKMFLDFAEMETFIGPSTGGDMTKVPSEAMRTAAGGSMVQGNAALPFKDIVRNFDSFTQSVILSLVHFNQVYNPDQAPKGDYDVIARGATSLVAKEVRGMQIDLLSQTLTDDERDHIDERKMVEAKVASRDLQGILVSPEQAARNKEVKAQQASQMQDLQIQSMEAEIKKTITEAFKNVSQGQKNSAAADKTSVDAAMTMIDSTEPANDTKGTNGRTRKKAT